MLVDHGSRSEASNEALDLVAREVAELAGGRFVAVLPSHMEIARPSIADAFESAVAAGAEVVIVALYFLGPGRHSEVDAPRLAAEAAASYPGLRFTVTRSLGPDQVLSHLVLSRAAEVLESQDF